MLIIVHVIIGIAISVFKPVANIYSLLIVIFFLINITFSKNKHQSVLLALAYIAGSDVFLRMTNGLIFYELHKYLIILFSLIGIFLKNGTTKGYQYLIYILLLIPAIFAGDYTLEDEVRKLIAFNLSGPVSLAIVSFYLYQRKIKFKDLNTILLYFSLPIIAMASYMYNYVDVSAIVFGGTQSNFITSGGFGPNQVSTILGIAAFIMLTRLLLTFKFLNIITVINLFLFVFLTYRSVLTFSRGGVLSLLLSSLIFIFVIFYYGNSKYKFKIIALSIGGLFLIISIWSYTNIQTSGMINNRYTNKNASGTQKKDVSAGRETLIEYELNAFKDNPIFGIGAGKGKDYRYQRSGIVAASHNEMTRLLAEHGIFGAMALLIILLVPFLVRFNMKSNIYFYSFFLTWFLTINHSATRIAAPAFIYALSLIDVIYEKKLPKKKSIER